MDTEIGSEENLLASMEDLRRASKRAELLHRLCCVRLSLAGCRISDVAEWMGVHPRTVARWNAAYRAEGVEALKVKPRPGRPPRLTRDQWQSLYTDFVNGPEILGYHRDEWDGRLLAAHIAGRYEVKISLRQCQRLLRKLRSATLTEAAPGRVGVAPPVLSDDQDEDGPVRAPLPSGQGAMPP